MNELKFLYPSFVSSYENALKLFVFEYIINLFLLICKFWFCLCMIHIYFPLSLPYNNAGYILLKLQKNIYISGAVSGFLERGFKFTKSTHFPSFYLISFEITIWPQRTPTGFATHSQYLSLLLNLTKLPYQSLDFMVTALICSRFAYSHFTYSRFPYNLSHFAYACFAYTKAFQLSHFAYSVKMN